MDIVEISFIDFAFGFVQYQHCINVYNVFLTYFKLGNKITKREWTPPIDFYTKWARELGLGYIVHLPPLYSLTKHARFCEPGVVTFSRCHLLFVCRRTSRKLLGGNWWGSRQLRMLTWFSVIWSLFQFLVIIDYFLGKPHIESTMLCYILAKHARFCEPGIVTFSQRHIWFLCRRTSWKQLRENWRGSCQLRMLTWFSLIWSQFQFLVTIDYFLGKKHRVYALCIDPTGTVAK